MQRLILAFMVSMLVPVLPGSSSGSIQSDVMDARSRKLAGPEAIDCGAVQIKQDPASATNCALNAFTNKRPFYVHYYVHNIDSVVAGGFAYDNKGNLSALVFDSAGFTAESLRKGSRLVDGRHIIIEPCPQPIVLHKSRRGRLTCFPASRRNLMSAEWW